MSKLKVFSFFAGCGFLDLGFELANYDIELVNEFSPSFMDAYIKSRELMNLRKPKYGYSNIDINEYLHDRNQELCSYLRDASKKGSLIGFIGGPPCPDFSVAGKQRGRNGDNGKLSLSYVELIINQKPDFFLFENVKGLWKTAKHREYYEDLKKMLSSAGYLMTDRLTNSIEFGAPQDRDRILLFGVSSRVTKDLNLDISSFPWEKYMSYDLIKVKNLNWPETEQFEDGSSKPCPKGIIKELTVQYWFEKNDVLHHPNANDFFVPRGGQVKMETIDEGDVFKKSYKRIHRWRYSPTVAYGNNEVHLHPYKIRRLSVSEALSLQSLPKDFSLPPNMSLTDKFKTIGNGVPFLLANGIAKTIKDFLEGGKKQNEQDNGL